MHNRRNRRSLAVLVVAVLATAAYGLTVIAPGGAATKTQPPASHPAGNDDIALMVLANMARSQPSADHNGTESVQPPLLWNDNLYAAALFHSEDMAKNNCFGHPSCNGGSWSTRVASYYGSYQFLGENVIGLGGPEEMHTGWMGSPGHRANILNGAFNEFGGGTAWGADGFGPVNYGTEDFGLHSLFSLNIYPKIPAAAILPRQGASTDTREFLVNVFDTAGIDSVNAVVNGQSSALSLYRGTNKNGTYRLTKTIGGNGCVPLYFEAHKGTSTFRWPESNSILVGVNRDDCAERTGTGTTPTTTTPTTVHLPPTTATTTTTTTTLPRSTGGVPTVTITSPSPGTVRGSVQIRATAADNGKIASMEVWVDGRKLVTRKSASIVRQWTAGAGSVKPGAHTITVKAYDGDGNVGLSSVVVTK